jgi:hypothetical protein
MGVASDGTEIVALLAHNASWSMTKGFRFAFMSTGLTGIFGEVWEILTVTSALHLWYLDFQDATVAAAAAAFLIDELHLGLRARTIVFNSILYKSVSLGYLD